MSSSKVADYYRPLIPSPSLIAGFLAFWITLPPPTPGTAYDVVVAGATLGEAGDRAYVADGPWGLQILDISDPAMPVIMGSVDTDFAVNVDVAGVHAYIVDYSDLLLIADISDSIDMTPWGISDVKVVGAYAYAATSYCTMEECFGRLVVLDISDSASPIIMGWVDTDRSAAAVAVAGNYAYVGSNTLQVIDISNPTLPIMVEPGITYFYRLEALDRRGGLELHGPIMATAAAAATSPVVHRDHVAQNSPNPFRSAHGSTAIPFELAKRMHATLEVFDVAGRHVRLILDEALESGEHQAFWATGSRPASSRTRAPWYT